MIILSLTSIPWTKPQWRHYMWIKSVWHYNGLLIPDCLSCHHKDLTFGRTQSCHHPNPVAGRTVDMSICPATTCSQTWGGRSTYHRMKSIMGRSICREPHRSNTLIQLELLDIEPFQCCQTSLIPILLRDCCIVDSEIYRKADLIQKLCMT